jgi:NAD(P)-dependent dehydrogenase (short-subunit alcohol dehydrogenase family)
MTAGLLEGRVIAIIGGTAGLGLSAAQACLAAGALGLVVTGRDDEAVPSARTTLGSQCEVVVGDAAESGHAEEAVKLAVSRFGRLDGLYHVAGGSGRRAGDGPLHEVTDDAVAATLHLNLHSMIFSNRAAVRTFLERGTPGVILNVGSVLAWSPSPRFFATHVYAAAKSAVVGLSKAAAAYYAPHNIRVNVIAPALVDTPMAHRAVQDPAIAAFVRSKQPLDGGRIGVPGDCDGAAVFLLSEGARFITGQVLAVDGGWTVSEGRA